MHVIEEQFKHTADQDDTQGDKVWSVDLAAW